MTPIRICVFAWATLLRLKKWRELNEGYLDHVLSSEEESFNASHFSCDSWINDWFIYRQSFTYFGAKGKKWRLSKVGPISNGATCTKHHALTLGSCFRQSRSNWDTREMIAGVKYCFATSLCFECGILQHNFTNMCQIISNYLGKSLSGPPGT